MKRYRGKVALIKDNFYEVFENRKVAAEWLVSHNYAPNENAAKVSLTYAVTQKNHQYACKNIAYGFEVKKV